MRVRLLGSVDVIVGGVPRPVSGLRRRALLAVLAVVAGEVVSTDRLIDAVWNGRPPATALNTLQSHVSYLRGLLGGRETIVARPPGYLLDVGADGTDLQVAARLIDEGRRATQPAQKVARLRAALSLWRGPPLADLRGLNWLEGEAERLAAFVIRWNGSTWNTVAAALSRTPPPDDRPSSRSGWPSRAPAGPVRVRRWVVKDPPPDAPRSPPFGGRRQGPSIVSVRFAYAFSSKR